MSDRIRPLLEYLLDTETTSEVTFYEKLHDSDDLVQARSRGAYEATINVKFQQWKDFDLKERSIVESRSTTTVDDDSSLEETDDESVSDDEEQEQTVPVGPPRKQQVSLENWICGARSLRFSRHQRRSASLSTTSTTVDNAHGWFSACTTVSSAVQNLRISISVRWNVAWAVTAANSLLLLCNKSFRISPRWTILLRNANAWLNVFRKPNPFEICPNRIEL